MTPAVVPVSRRQLIPLLVFPFFTGLFILYNEMFKSSTSCFLNLLAILIGIMLWTGKGFEVRQFFARNYAEEAAAIHGIRSARRLT